MTKPEIKNIIRELVGFERQYIEPINWEQTRFGGISEIYFKVKDFYYVLNIGADETFTLSFADEPTPADGKPEQEAPTEALATEETANA